MASVRIAILMTDADSNASLPLRSYVRPLSRCFAATPIRQVHRFEAASTAASIGDAPRPAPVVAHADARRSARPRNGRSPLTPALPRRETEETTRLAIGLRLDGLVDAADEAGQDVPGADLQ